MDQYSVMGTLLPDSDRRESLSDSDIFSYLSGIDSPIPPLQYNGTLSPHSSASPSSAFSVTPDDFLNNTLSSVDLDALFQQQEQPLYFPTYPLPDFNPATIPPQWMQLPVKEETSAPVPKSAPKRRRKQDEEPAPVGKHNKTERRYRQKVQAAQADLRDAVPALRVLYGTSTEEQKQTTDFRAPNGTVDGLGEIARPNSSAKATIFVGAKLYIELLQRRVGRLERKVQELEAFRSAVAGEDDLNAWRQDFESRQQDEPIPSPPDYDDDEDEEEVPSKKAKTARAFAAFAMAFAFLPSSSTTSSPSGVISNPTTAQVISRFPHIAAEHATRVLAPFGLAPLVDWTFRLLATMLVAFLFAPLFSTSLVQEVLQVVTNAPVDPKWTKLAAGTLGKGTSNQRAQCTDVVQSPSRLTRWRMRLHLQRAHDLQSITLLALIRHSDTLWAKTQMPVPLNDALQILQEIAPTPSPLAAIRHRVHLTHLNDLYSRMFVRLVNASTKSGTTLTALPRDPDAAFGKEIRRVLEVIPDGTPAYSLTMVLVGLWSIFSGGASQTALAGALKERCDLASVSAMLSLICGTPFRRPTMMIAPDALAVDRLAVVCVEYVRLLTVSDAAPLLVRNITAALRLALVQTHFDEEDADAHAAKEKLVTVLSHIGRRAAGRATGEEYDSGVECDMKEL